MEKRAINENQLPKRNKKATTLRDRKQLKGHSCNRKDVYSPLVARKAMAFKGSRGRGHLSFKTIRKENLKRKHSYRFIKIFWIVQYFLTIYTNMHILFYAEMMGCNKNVRERNFLFFV